MSDITPADLFQQLGAITREVHIALTQLTAEIRALREAVQVIATRADNNDGALARNTVTIDVIGKSIEAYGKVIEEHTRTLKRLEPLGIVADDVRVWAKSRKDAERNGLTRRATFLEVLRSPWSATLALGVLWLLREAIPWMSTALQHMGNQ